MRVCVYLLHAAFIHTLLTNELHLQGSLQRVVGRRVLYLQQGIMHQVRAAPCLHATSVDEQQKRIVHGEIRHGILLCCASLLTTHRRLLLRLAQNPLT